MRKSRSTEAQVVADLQDGESGLPVAKLLHEQGISRQTYHHRKAKYVGSSGSELRRPKELEAENAERDPI